MTCKCYFSFWMSFYNPNFLCDPWSANFCYVNSGGGGISMADVAKHNSKTDCWVVVDGQVRWVGCEWVGTLVGCLIRPKMVGIGWDFLKEQHKHLRLNWNDGLLDLLSEMEKHPCKNGSVQKRQLEVKTGIWGFFFWNNVEVHEFLYIKIIPCGKMVPMGWSLRTCGIWGDMSIRQLRGLELSIYQVIQCDLFLPWLEVT